MIPVFLRWAKTEWSVFPDVTRNPNFVFMHSAPRVGDYVEVRDFETKPTRHKVLRVVHPLRSHRTDTSPMPIEVFIQ